MTWTEQCWQIPESIRVLVASHPQDCRGITSRLLTTLETLELRPTLRAYARRSGCRWDADVVLALAPIGMHRPQSYRISVESGGISVVGADWAGLFYGVCTVCQMFKLWFQHREAWGTSWSGLILHDWPDFRDRGVMLDISRDKVPQMDTLYRLIDQLAGWKINQIQLYMEHTFAYEGHEEVWQQADPMTGEQILALDAYCRERFIDLVPNQNSLGHMHRWLIHEKYRVLAECPEGIDHPFSPNREPYSLCPTDPASRALIEDLYQQLLPHFSSRMFNVGLDETFDLGLGRSAVQAETLGADGLYISFLQFIHQTIRGFGKTMQFWADIVLQKPDRLEELPDDAIALLWGYEDTHPFEEQCSSFAQLGLAHYVCPGTSSWNSWAGRTRNTLGNLHRAAIAGSKSGALGYLVTDWGDFGHMQPLPISYLGLLAGASMSWKVQPNQEPSLVDWAALLDAHIFFDHAGRVGQILCDLGDLYLLPGGPTFNSSPLFRLVVLFATWPPSRMKEKGLSRERLLEAQAAIAPIMARLAEHRMQCSDSAWVVDELQWCGDILDFSCRFALARMDAPQEDIGAIPLQERQSLVAVLDSLIERHQVNWLRRNRKGGLADSVQRLQQLRSALVNEQL